MKRFMQSQPLLMLGLAVFMAAAFHFGVVDQSNMAFLGMAGIMSQAGARIVDPVLSSVAQGYQNNEMVAPYLFPVVPVDQRGGKIIQFNREDFRLYNTGRTPGANTKRVSYGYLGNPYALEQHALEGLVPFEVMQEANAVPGIEMGRGAVMKTQNIIQLRNEKASADIARNTGNYAASNKVTLAGTSQWSDYSGTSNPTKDIETAKEAVRANTGKRPNTVLLSPKAWAAAKQHPFILDRIKYTGRDSITAEMLAALWVVKRVVVGDAIYEDAAGTLTDVWGRDVVVAYTELGTLADGGLPSYGYTYRLRNHPMVEMPYMDRNAKSWIYPVTDELSPVLAAALAGYLITNASA